MIFLVRWRLLEEHYTDDPFNVPVSGTTRVSRYQWNIHSLSACLYTGLQ